MIKHPVAVAPGGDINRLSCLLLLAIVSGHISILVDMIAMALRWSPIVGFAGPVDLGRVVLA